MEKPAPVPDSPAPVPPNTKARPLGTGLQRERRLNALLRAVRGVNQLITKVNDREALIDGACRELTGTMGYTAAWIALTRPSGELATVAASCASDPARAEAARQKLLGGQRPECLVRSLQAKESVVTDEPSGECWKCVFADSSLDDDEPRAAMSRRLEFAGRVFGVLSVSVPKAFLADEEERTLFAEIAGDLGFALQKIEKAESEQRLHTMRLRTERIAGIGSWEWDLETDEVVWSEELFRLFGIDPAGVAPAYRDQVALYHPEDRRHLDEAARRCREDGTPFELELRIIRPDGVVRNCIGRGEAERDASGQVRRLFGSLQDVTDRRQAELALQHAYERISFIFEHMNSAAAVFDRELRFLHVSRRFLESYRVEEKDIIGRHHYEVFPDIPEKWRDVHQRALAGEVLSGDRDRFERADGTVDWTRWQCRPWHDHRGEIGGIILYTEVITDRVQAENELRESELRYRALFENNHAVMLLIDPATLEVVDANPAAVRFYGWDRKQLQGMPVSSINTLSPEELRAEIADARAARRNQFIFRHRLADRSCRDVEVYTGSLELGGRPILYSIVHDITERRLAERALQESEERQRALIEASPLALFALDRERKVLAWNAAAERIFGWSEEEVKGRVPPIVPSGEEAFFETLTGRVLSGETVSRAEVTRQCRDGSFVEVSLSAGPVRDSRGAIVGIIAAMEDISTRRRLEREQALLLHELQDKKEAAEAASRAKDEFLAVMSHEMRTPLNAILGFSNLLLEDAGNEGDREALSAIVNAGEQQLRLVDDILEFARLDRGRLRPKPQVFRLLSLCQQVVRDRQRNADARGLSLVLENGFDATSEVAVDGEVRTDFAMLTRVLENLVDNACKYTREGSVALRVGRRSRGSGGGRFRFEVIDTGIGIEPGKVSQIFHPFTQVDSSYTREFGGAGLGLAICQKLVGALGGEIEVESVPGKGSRFHFELELEEVPEGAKAHEAGASLGWPRLRLPRVLSVLVVDDRPSNAGVIRALLERLGARVTTASSGPEALERSAEGTFDVILMDLSMPGMDGFETTRRLQSDEGPNQHTPIISVTADASERSAVLSREAGMVHHLTKPVRLAPLFDALRPYTEPAARN